VAEDARPRCCEHAHEARRVSALRWLGHEETLERSPKGVLNAHLE